MSVELRRNDGNECFKDTVGFERSKTEAHFQ